MNLQAAAERGRGGPATGSAVGARVTFVVVKKENCIESRNKRDRPYVTRVVVSQALSPGSVHITSTPGSGASCTFPAEDLARPRGLPSPAQRACPAFRERRGPG